jgi:hypothetical protein
MVAMGVVFRRKKSGPAPQKASDPAIPPELQRQIDDELSKLD